MQEKENVAKKNTRIKSERNPRWMAWPGELEEDTIHSQRSLAKEAGLI